MLGSQCVGIVFGFASPTSADIRLYFSLSDSGSNLFISIPWLSAMLGPIAASCLLRRRGNRFFIQVAALFGALSWSILLTANPEDERHCLAHRVLSGVTSGALDLIVPDAMLELSPLEARWIYGSMHHVGVCVGYFVVNCGGLFLDWWQLAVYAMAVCAALAVAAAFLPNARSSAGESSCQWWSAKQHASLRQSLLLIFIQKVSGFTVILSNLVVFSGQKTNAALASFMLVLGVVVRLGLCRRMSRFAMWCVSLFGSAGALFMIGWHLRTAAIGWSGALSISTFCFLFAFGLMSIPSQVRAESFQDGRLKEAAQVSFAIVDYVLSFLLLSAYPVVIKKFSPGDLINGLGLVLLLVGVYGCYLMKGSPEMVEGDKEELSLIDPDDNGSEEDIDVDVE
jgi:MFS family permease